MQIITRDILQSFFRLNYQHYLSYIKQQQQQSVKKQQQKYLHSLKQLEQHEQELKQKQKQGNKNKSKTRGDKKSKSMNKSDKRKYQCKEESQAKEMISKKYDRIKQFIKNHRFYEQQQQDNNHNKTTFIQNCLKQLQQKLTLSIKHKTSSLASTSSSKYPQKPSPSSSPFYQPLQILSLYLNKQTNKQIFLLYQHILQSPSGISYESLAKKLKTDIINVSHYCCKLKKMRFVEWEHKKDGVVVYAKWNIHEKDIKDKQQNNKQPHTSQSLHSISLSQQNNFSYCHSFLFPTLTIPQTILLTLSSYSSLSNNGFTNQQIKHKLMKHSQNKMIRRTVESMKNITKTAERQGKMQKQIDRKRNENVIELNKKCKGYINTVIKQYQLQQLNQQQHRQHLASLHSQQLLLQLINTKLTQYHSSIGIKHSKRQCTPLKLNRYIIILNYLQYNGPQIQYQLRRYIIEQEQEYQINNGVMHKRSMIGILEGLEKIKLVEQVGKVYYPMWWENEKREDRKKEIRNRNVDLKRMNIDGEDQQDQFKSDYEDNQLNLLQQYNKSGKKKVKLDHNSNKKQQRILPQLSQFNHNIPIKMITQKQNLAQIFTSLLTITLQNSLYRIYRKSFHRIMYTHRKKQSVQMYKPQMNMFYLLDQQQKQCLSSHKEQQHMTNNNNNNKNYNNNNNNNNNFLQNENISKTLISHPSSYPQFLSSIDNFIQQHGHTLDPYPQIQYQIIKYIRRHPIKNQNNLKSKYGKNWKSKFEELEKCNIIKINENGYEMKDGYQGYIV